MIPTRNRNKEKVAEYNRAYYAANKEKKAEYDHAYYVANPEKALLSSARNRANLHTREFSITVDDICIPEVCPVLGIPLVKGKGKPTPSSPTVDMLDSSKGYVPGNIQVISYRASKLKTDGTTAELLRIAINSLERQTSDTVAMRVKGVILDYLNSIAKEAENATT